MLRTIPFQIFSVPIMHRLGT